MLQPHSARRVQNFLNRRRSPKSGKFFPALANRILVQSSISAVKEPSRQAWKGPLRVLRAREGPSRSNLAPLGEARETAPL